MPIPSVEQLPPPAPHLAAEPSAAGPARSSRLAKFFSLVAASAVGVLLCAAVIAGAMWGRGFLDPGPAAAADEDGNADASAAKGGFASSSGSDADNANLAARVHEILKTNCYACHGEGGAAEGGFNFVLRRDKLVEGSYVAPGDPANSYLLERIRDGEMPPRSETQRPSEAEVALITQWIAAGAPDFSAPIERTFVTDREVFRQLRADVQATDARDRRFLRYFSLVHLYNAGISDDELTTYRLALSKLVNSLSRNRRIVNPTPIDPQGNLLRLDLRDVKWTAEIWKKLTDANPYGIVFDFADAQAVYAATESQVPVLRGDWMVAAASRPPLYHEVLQIPATLDELLKTLGVDSQRNIAEDRVLRAGFSNSGVSQNNRMIERHDFRDGAVWISYDFAENTGRRNLFAHPLGPGSEEKHFLHDGGEIIFNLPNGLQGYMLVDGAGKRLDKGPTEIVSDNRRPDRAVQNGISCMSCHYAGIIVKADEVRAHVLANRAGFADDLEDILALYKPNETITALQKEDAQRFQQALQPIGVERVTETNEPIINMAIRFEANLDLKLTAAELGLTPEEFTSKLRATPALARFLGVVNAGAELKRDVFVKVFREAVTAFGLGTPVGTVDTPTPPAAEVAAKEKAAPKDKETAAAAPAAPKDKEAAAAAPSQGTGLRTWTDVTGKFKVAAQFVGFDDTNVRLRKEDGKVVSVAISVLSEADQKFVLAQPPGASIDLPPGEQQAGNTAATPPAASGDYAYSPNAPDYRGGSEPLFGNNEYHPPTNYGRGRGGLRYPDAPPRKWTPLSNYAPFEATFHHLEAGWLYLRLPTGAVIQGPLLDMSLDDRQYVRGVVGPETYREEAGPPPGAFDFPRPSR